MKLDTVMGTVEYGVRIDGVPNSTTFKVVFKSGLRTTNVEEFSYPNSKMTLEERERAVELFIYAYKKGRDFDEGRK